MNLPDDVIEDEIEIMFVSRWHWVAHLALGWRFTQDEPDFMQGRHGQFSILMWRPYRADPA